MSCVSLFSIFDLIQKIDVQHIKNKADNAGHKNEGTALYRPINRGRQGADTLADRDQHGLPLGRLPVLEHIEISDAHGDILQECGILFSFDAAELSHK